MVCMDPILEASVTVNPTFGRVCWLPLLLNGENRESEALSDEATAENRDEEAGWRDVGS